MRTMDRSYEDIEMKGASASETGVKNDMDSSSDIQEIMENGDQDKRDMLRLGKQQELKRAWGFWSALGFVGKLNIRSLGGQVYWDRFGPSWQQPVPIYLSPESTHMNVPTMNTAANETNSCIHGILGIHPDLALCGIRKRWFRRSLRLLHLHGHLLLLRRSQSCRDGIDGTYFRRPIPLGV